jgi:DNA-binding transcriptional LysR family regulator
MDRIEAMRVFARVAETRSFTAASRSLGRSKASVSQTVAMLEERVGARLLQRTTRRVELTRDGALFHERCRDLLTDFEELETLFVQSDQSLSGRIRVDMSSRTARFTVIPRLPLFLARHPGIQVELGVTDRAVDLVREGYDCVVRGGEVGESGLVARRIGEVPVINCASPRYLEEHGRPRTLDDLDRHYLVHYTPTLGQKPEGWEYQEGGEWKERPMRGRIAVNSADAYVAACLAGLGLIQTPRSSLEEDLQAGRLIEVLPRHRARPMPITILYPHRRHLSRRVRAFMDWLAEQLGTGAVRQGARDAG